MYFKRHSQTSYCGSTGTVTKHELLPLPLNLKHFTICKVACSSLGATYFKLEVGEINKLKLLNATAAKKNHKRHVCHCLLYKYVLIILFTLCTVIF